MWKLAINRWPARCSRVVCRWADRQREGALSLLPPSLSLTLPVCVCSGYGYRRLELMWVTKQTWKAITLSVTLCCVVASLRCGILRAATATFIESEIVLTLVCQCAGTGRDRRLWMLYFLFSLTFSLTFSCQLLIINFGKSMFYFKDFLTQIY